MTALLIIMAVIMYFCDLMSHLKILPFRIVWSLALCYVIYACVSGCGGYVNWFLSLPAWHPLSRLSFAMVLFEELLMEILLQDAQEFSIFEFVSRLSEFRS